MQIIQRIKHLFGIHNYTYVKRLSPNSHMLKCSICSKRFVINTSARVLVDWDLEMEDFYYGKHGCDFDDVYLSIQADKAEKKARNQRRIPAEEVFKKCELE